MPLNMEWKCCSLVFLFGYKSSVFTMFSLKKCDKAIWLYCQNKICCAQNRIYFTYIKGCGIGIRSIHQLSIFGFKHEKMG